MLEVATASEGLMLVDTTQHSTAVQTTTAMAAPLVVPPSSETAIMVAVRVRPFSDDEKALLPRQMNTQFGPTARNFTNYEEPEEAPVAGGKVFRKVVHTIDDHVLVFDPPDENETRQATMGASNKRHKDIRFVFDRVYGEESTQQDVYEGTTRGLLDSVMAGYNATVFAYGATGCGKTYTISGCPDDPGIIFLTMQELFARVTAAEDEKAIEVTLSYLEVYNETIRDLLAPDNTQALALREDARQGVTVAGLSQHVPGGVNEVMELMIHGNSNRTMSPTEANAVSSRSHAVMQVHVKQRPKDGGLQTDVTSATLSIIDLAGSERATVTRNNGARMREGANINRSLLALANCINALCDQRTKRHIPYRDSKLTRLLKFSLGGNCRTVMITCVSPASTYYEETHNTLKYANRAKNIKTTVAKNTKSTQVHLAQYQGKIREQSDEIKRLQREIAKLKSRGAVSNGPANSSRTNVQAAQAMAELRKQTQAIQVVQDIRNKMSNVYGPIREAKWEHASAHTIGQWYDSCAESLKSWREQFETLFQEHQHLGALNETDTGDYGDGTSYDSSAESVELARRSQVFKQQVDDLVRELTRERKTIGRHEEHSMQLIERNMYMADRAAQVPPSAQLTAEQRYHVDQEHRVLSLSAERNGLRRQVALGEHIAQVMTSQNTALLRLTATCLFSLKRAIYGVHQRHDSDGVEKALDQIYMQAIASFSEATGMVRSSIKQVQDAGGPSKLEINGSVLTPPSPFIPRSSVLPDSNPQLSPSNVAADKQRRRDPRGGVQANGGAPPRNPNTGAISAAVAGTSRARRATLSTNTMQSLSGQLGGGGGGGATASTGPGVTFGRHMRVSPPKRSQGILGRTAARPPPGNSTTSNGASASSLSSASATNTATTTTAENRRARRISRVGATNGTQKAFVRAGGSRPAPVHHSSATETDTLSQALKANVTVTSPPLRKLALENTSSISLPSPNTSIGSISPASSVASWASADTNPHHEPLPAEAKPLKGILKGSSGGQNAVRSANGSAPAFGPIRLGNERRKSRHARVKANPTSRGSGTSPKPTPAATVAANIRELSFKSVGTAAKKPPAWR
ncbi:tubulin-dependent ATPase kip3 [Coemansia sp. RSA 986]|nr:tubulin-dependent ATPase kip3 [Coemansia sp. RSA 986]